MIPDELIFAVGVVRRPVGGEQAHDVPVGSLHREMVVDGLKIRSPDFTKGVVQAANSNAGARTRSFTVATGGNERYHQVRMNPFKAATLTEQVRFSRFIATPLGGLSYSLPRPTRIIHNRQRMPLVESAAMQSVAISVKSVGHS